MNKFISVTITLLALLSNLPVATAQEATEDAVDNARAERQARIEELRRLTREEQAARRQDIERWLEGLSEDERQALRERRRMQQQARARQGQRGQQGERQQRQRQQQHQRRAQESEAANQEAEPGNQDTYQ